MPRKPADMPRQLKVARQRFERWRTRRKPGDRIPDALWRAAVNVARVHGVHRVARAIGLDYMGLKKRVAGTTADRRKKKTGPPKFLEVFPSASIVPAECVVEFENAHGAKMRLSLKSVDADTLGALARCFLREE